MTREEAKALLLNISAYDIDTQRGMAKQEAIEMAIKALEQETSRSGNSNRWIPVSERLPESSGVYIVTREFTDGFKCADLTDACYFDGTSTWHDDNRINHDRAYVDKKIKAWMPLPEPYKAESEG